MKAELQIAPDEWEAVEDGLGYEVRPFEYRQVWPKYRIDPDTDKPYTREQLIEALRAAGFGDLVVETPEQYAYPGMVRDAVKRWRHRVGEHGVKVDGKFVDAHGNELTGAELDDPTADILALPPALRVVIEPVEPLDIRYTRVPSVGPPPLPEIEPDAQQA